MDLHCPCGYMGHVDASFAYAYLCPQCKRLYEVGSHVTLHPVDSVDHECVVTDDSYDTD